MSWTASQRNTVHLGAGAYFTGLLFTCVAWLLVSGTDAPWTGLVDGIGVAAWLRNLIGGGAARAVSSWIEFLVGFVLTPVTILVLVRRRVFLPVRVADGDSCPQCGYARTGREPSRAKR